MKAFTIEVFVELHKHRNEEVKEFQAPRAVLVVAGIGNILERNGGFEKWAPPNHPFVHGFSWLFHYEASSEPSSYWGTHMTMEPSKDGRSFGNLDEGLGGGGE